MLMWTLYVTVRFPINLCIELYIVCFGHVSVLVSVFWVAGVCVSLYVSVLQSLVCVRDAVDPGNIVNWYLASY